MQKGEREGEREGRKWEEKKGRKREEGGEEVEAGTHGSQPLTLCQASVP